MSRVVSLKPVYRADKTIPSERPRHPAKLHKSRPPPKHYNPEERQSGFLHFSRPSAPPAGSRFTASTKTASSSSASHSNVYTKSPAQRPQLQLADHYEVPWETLRQQGLVLRGSAAAFPRPSATAGCLAKSDGCNWLKHVCENSLASDSPTRRGQYEPPTIVQTRLPNHHADRHDVNWRRSSREPSLARSTASGRSIRSQLRPDNTFLYERPSKASYIAREDSRLAHEMEKLTENERHLQAAMGRCRPSTPTTTASVGPPTSRSSFHSTASGLYACTRDLFSQSTMPPPEIPQFMTSTYGVQHPPIPLHHIASHTASSLGRTVYPSTYNRLPGSLTPSLRQRQSHPPGESQNLQRYETIASSCYSQLSMREVYPPALVPGSRPPSQAGSTSLTFSSSSETSPSLQADSGRPQQSFGTAQLLWQNLYNELLEQDPAFQIGTQRSVVQHKQRELDLQSQRGSIDVCPASPVPITPLRLHKTSCSAINDNAKSARPSMVRSRELHQQSVTAETAAYDIHPISMLAPVEPDDEETFDFTALASPASEQNTTVASFCRTSHDAVEYPSPRPCRRTRIPAPRPTKFAGISYKKRSAIAVKP